MNFILILMSKIIQMLIVNLADELECSKIVESFKTETTEPKTTEDEQS